jgi:Cd2+/Zn2+-exporting ATPase
MATTKIYLLEGLCCPNCAAAIESEVGGLEGVKKAAVDYPNTTVTVVFDAGEDDMFRAVSSAVSEVDEDIVVKNL